MNSLALTTQTIKWGKHGNERSLSQLAIATPRADRRAAKILNFYSFSLCGVPAATQLPQWSRARGSREIDLRWVSEILG